MDLIIINFFLSLFGCLIGTYIFDFVAYGLKKFSHRVNFTISIVVAIFSTLFHLIYK